MSQSPGIPFTALVQLENRPEVLAQLKRLALLFDHISYRLPDAGSVITETLLPAPGRKLEELSFVQRRPDGSLDFSGFNYFRDCSKPLVYTLDNLDVELQEAILQFQEAGVMSAYTGIRDDSHGGQLVEVCDILASVDAQDKEFNRISETNPTDYYVFNNVQYVTLHSISEPAKEPFTFAAFPEPRAIKDSRQLTEMFYAANAGGVFPVFLNPRHREEVRYRYDQFLEALEIVRNTYPDLVSPAHFRGRFGEVSFAVASAVFSSDLISEKSVADILGYREAMQDSRRKYVAHDLMELAAIVRDNPWDSHTKEEVERYIVGKLNHDLFVFDDESRQLWEQMFGSLAVQTAEVTKSAGWGGGALALLGQLIPNATTWELIVLGAIAGVIKESPKLVKTLTDFLVDFRARRRSAISYLANFK